jgi:hypothetical protein
MNNINSIDPKLWGSHAWRFLYYISLAYPEKPTDTDKYNMKYFLESLKNILPCDKCRINYEKNITKYPLTDKVLSNNVSLVEWISNIHNQVNIETNKPTLSLTYQDIYHKYITKTQYSNLNYCTVNISGTFVNIFILIVMITVILLFLNSGVY